MNKSDKKTALVLAADLNFYGKRLGTAKALVAEAISSKLYGTAARSAEVREFLEANPPAKKVTPATRKVKAVCDLPVEGGKIAAAVAGWPTLPGRRFILTSAQNNTTVHQNFLKSLVGYAETLEATLLISQYLYNKNGFQNGNGEKGIRFSPELEKYFVKENVFLNNPSFAFLAAINILPTATYPLSGFSETIGNFSAAIGHAQITSEAVPSMKGSEVRRLYSTGTVTQRNYIQQKAGQKAEALHSYGALIVEFDADGNYFARQLQTMDESGLFYDLTYCATPEKVEIATDHVAALQYGDIHAEKISEEVAYASWGAETALVDVLKPKYQLIHDIHDFTSRNHHNRMSGVFLAKQLAAGRDKVIDDLRDTGKILSDMERDFSQLIVVESNHDLALSRWLDDPKVSIGQDPANAHLYHSLNAAIYNAIHTGDDTFNVLSYALKEFGGYDVNATFLETDQSFTVAGIEMGMHGHNGINGSRGAPKQFKKLGVPANTGHTHSPTIFGGVYTAGVSGSLDMGYNIGAGSWCHTHIITYKNGQRTLIDFKNGAFWA